MECAAVREFTGVHNMIRGLMRLMEASVAGAKPDNTKQIKVLSAFGQFAITGTHFHHHAEDNYYWPAIVKNGADASLLEPLVKEHKMIDPLLDETESAFVALATGSTDDNAVEALRGLVGRFIHDMLTHLDNEEPVFFPLLTQYMPDDESERLAVELAKTAPRQRNLVADGWRRVWDDQGTGHRVPRHLPKADPMVAPAASAQVQKGLPRARRRPSHSIATLS